MKKPKPKPPDALRDIPVQASEPPLPRRKPKRARSGPEPERLKIEGDWVAAVGVAAGKKRPPGGWPK